MRRTRVVALLAFGALVAIAVAAAGPAHAFTLKVTGPAAAPKMVFDDNMKVATVCLPVTNPAGGQSILYGQRYSDGPVTANTPAIVLVHGIASNTLDWDYSPTWSVARALASAGYLVFSYDRLGYDKSSYFSQPGGGETLTTAAHRAMLHNVVTDVKSGGYRIAASGSGCSGATLAGDTTSHSAVVIGHSAGGWVVAGYPGTYHDVSAMVEADIDGSGSNMPNGVAPGGGFTPDPAHPDYFQFFQNEQGCLQFDTYTPGEVKYVADIACKPPYLDSPFGEIADLGVKFQENDAAIAQIGPSIPVLLTSGDHDTTDPETSAKSDFAYFKAHCGCDVSQLFLPQTAHLFMAHRSLPIWVDHVVDWLTAHGIKGTSAATAAPTISKARLTRKHFRAGRRTSRKMGTKFRFRLSGAATVTIRIVRLRGRHRTIGTLTRSGRSGANRVAFSGRIRHHTLKPGRYRAVLRATNAGGQSRAVRLRFTVLR
jgi:pimeloyl-ACP methyl ester carboxylesterase